MWRDAKKLIIDRIEGKFARVETETGELETVCLHQLPRGIKEQDLLIRTGGEFQIDPLEAEKRKEEVEDLYKRLLGESKDL